MNNRRNKAIILAKEKGYTVKDGIVYNKNGKALKLITNDRGYFTFGISLKKGDICHIPVHRYVAYNKFGNKIFKKGIQVRHLDSNPKNNFDNNIGIGTASDNRMDINEKVRRNAAIVATSFVLKHNHEYILELKNKGFTYRQIMDITGIKSKGTVSFIINKSMKAKEEK